MEKGHEVKLLTNIDKGRNAQESNGTVASQGRRQVTVAGSQGDTTGRQHRTGQLELKTVTNSTQQKVVKNIAGGDKNWKRQRRRS